MNLIFTSFYYNPGANKAHDVKIDTYLKLICVALISTKNHNPNDDVALIVPQSTRKLIDNSYVDLLEKHNITVKQIEFDCFKNEDDNAIWNFSLYALCCIEHLVKECEYENLCFIDSDTYCVKAFDDIWIDCNSWIMLCDINHSHEIRQAINTFNDYKAYSGNEVYITNWGGEFVAGSKEQLLKFVNHCLTVFNRLQEKKIIYEHGIETILAIASMEYPECRIKNANYFCFRYWTGKDFKILSTNYKYNSVGLYHVPAEKVFGLTYLYDYLYKNGSFPKHSKVLRTLGLEVKQKARPFFFFKKILSKFKKI